MDMVTFTRMSTALQNEMRERYQSIDDPEVRENWLLWGRRLIELSPELQLESRLAGQRGGQLHEARAMLRTLFEQRGLALSADLDARLDARVDLATLHRWFRAAVTAPSAAEALQ